MSARPKTILAFGEILWDLLPTGPVLGGAPFNFAYRLHGLGERALTVSRLGADDLGGAARREIAAAGMETHLLQADANRPTGTVHITFDQDKSADIRIMPRVAYDGIEMTTALAEAGASADCVCFGTVAQREALSRATLHAVLDAAPQALKVFDINLRRDCYTRDVVSTALERTDVLKLNGPEAGLLAHMYGLPFGTLPEFCDSLLRGWPLQCCLVTLEERGVFAASADGERAYVPGFRIALSDSLGAGDAFMAGFIYQRLRSMTLAQSGRFGCILGAMVATHRGATQPLCLEEVTQFPRTMIARCCDPRLMEYADIGEFGRGRK